MVVKSLLYGRYSRALVGGRWRNYNDTAENMIRSPKGEHRNILRDSSEGFSGDIMDESTEIWWFAGTSWHKASAQ